MVVSQARILVRIWYAIPVKEISIQDLKASLSSAISEAEAGNTIIITRHKEPVAQLTTAHPQYVLRGKRVATGKIKQALKRGTKGRYLAALLEDMANR